MDTYIFSENFSLLGILIPAGVISFTLVGVFFTLKEVKKWLLRIEAGNEYFYSGAVREMECVKKWVKDWKIRITHEVHVQDLMRDLPKLINIYWNIVSARARTDKRSLDEKCSKSGNSLFAQNWRHNRNLMSSREDEVRELIHDLEAFFTSARVILEINTMNSAKGEISLCGEEVIELSRRCKQVMQPLEPRVGIEKITRLRSVSNED